MDDESRTITVAIDADLRPFLGALNALIEALEAAREVLERTVSVTARRTDG